MAPGFQMIHIKPVVIYKLHAHYTFAMLDSNNDTIKGVKWRIINSKTFAVCSVVLCALYDARTFTLKTKVHL